MKKILIPTDFSQHAHTATNLAFSVAQKANANIAFVHMVQTPIEWGEIDLLSSGLSASSAKALEGVFPDVKAHLDQIKEKFEALVKQGKEKGIEVSYQVSHNKSSSDISKMAKEQNFDLIVIGTHGKHGAKAFLGSNTQKVVRHATCPVLTIKEPHENYSFKKIVFASDFEFKNSIPALQKVLAFAKLFEAEVHLVLVNTPSAFIDTKQSKERFENFLSHFKDETLYTHVYNQFSVDRGIIDFSTEEEMDLISIATNGFSGLRGFVHDSIAENVINYGNKPTLSLLLE